MLKQRPNWKLVDIYVDVRSGKDMSGREEFVRMMNDCFEGKTDLIITKSISRFGRNTVEILENIYKLRDHNVDAFFEIENIFISDTDNDFLLSVLGALAQADNVKLIFQLYLDGHSILSIIRELKKRGIKSPTGKEEWPKRTIETLLSNEKYIGNVLVDKTYGGDFPNNKRYTNKGERDQYFTNYTDETIIIPGDFERAQEEKVRRSNVRRYGEVSIRKDTHYSMNRKSNENH